MYLLILSDIALIYNLCTSNKAFKTVVPRNVALSEAPSYGKPVILYQAKARGTECYIELAKEILSKVNQQEQDK